MRAVPEVSRLQAFLEMPQMTADPVETFCRHQRRLGDDFVYRFGGVKRVRVISEPAMLRRILKENWQNYRKSDIQTRRMAHFLGPGLLTYHGDRWLRQRRLIQKGFTPARLDALVAIMGEALGESLAGIDDRLSEGNGQAEIDLSRAMTEMTFGMVVRSLFGADITWSEVAQISDTILRIQSFIVRQIAQPHLRPWFGFSGELARHETLRAEGDAIVRRHIFARRAGRAGARDDLLQILLDAEDDTGRGMTDGEVLCECIQLLVAGHETSSNALVWTLYLLERHPDRLAEMRREMDTVLGGRDPRPADIPNLPASIRMIEEALRLYPPFWMIDRQAVAEDEAGGRRIRRGETIVVFLYGLHRSEAHWDRPAQFDPARIGPSDRKTSRDFTYLPFGGGPRGCVGANFAILQMLMVLARFVRRHDWSIAGGAEVAPAPLIIFRQRDGVTTYLRWRDVAAPAGHRRPA